MTATMLQVGITSAVAADRLQFNTPGSTEKYMPGGSWIAGRDPLAIDR